MALTANELIRNRAQTVDSRTFFIGTITVPDPVEGQTVELCTYAPFGFEVRSISHRTDVGTLETRFFTTAGLIRFTGENPGGYLPAQSGAIDTFQVNPQGDGHETLAQSDKLYCVLENLSGDMTGYVLQIICRRLQIDEETPV